MQRVLFKGHFRRGINILHNKDHFSTLGALSMGDVYSGAAGAADSHLSRGQSSHLAGSKWQRIARRAIMSI